MTKEEKEKDEDDNIIGDSIDVAIVLMTLSSHKGGGGRGG